MLRDWWWVTRDFWIMTGIIVLVFLVSWLVFGGQ